MSKGKVAVIGIDSITPVMIGRFMAEGRMPNLQRLYERGWSSEITSTMPPTTPAAWTTVATGAWPSTHGIEGFAVHWPGDPLDKKRHSCSSSEVRSEFIWQTAEQAGKRSILLKYPVSWPPRGGDAVLQVDGAGGWGGLKCVWDLVHSGCWDSQATAYMHSSNAHALSTPEWLTRDQDNLDEEQTQRLEIGPPQLWQQLPADAEPLWETQLVLRNHGMPEGTPLYLLALRLNGSDRLALARDRVDDEIMLLSQGAWSDWIRVSIPTRDGPRFGHLRLKPMLFDAPGRRLRIYQTQIHQEAGFTRPASVAQELLAAAGPFAEWTEAYDLLQGWIDDQTQLEIYEQHVDWVSRAAQHLIRSHPWDLFMTQVHFVDMAYHLYWGAIDPGHPDYAPDRAGFYWELLGKVHELADRCLGAILEALDSDTLVIVLGDHGHDLYHTALLINHLLLQQGLLTLYRDRRTGAARIDWQRTHAYASGYRVFLNMAGRDPQGIIPTDDYRARQEQIIQALYAVRDPRTGHAPVRMAVRREDAESLGLYGETMGDVVFAMAPGYQVRSSLTVPPDAWVGQHLQLHRISALKNTRLFKEFTGEHDSALPFTRAIHSLLYMDGPGIRQGRRRVPVRMVDIAPTICHHLGIPFPANCEGGVLWDAYSGPL